ncbi:hypothetical protein [Flavobacterium sp.]|jgi:hypothetical protein|uniref:hypothetical protein n=1 Tax=Flavobacterium sp. TaxID=239 RepID=UPI0037C06CA8
MKNSLFLLFGVILISCNDKPKLKNNTVSISNDYFEKYYNDGGETSRLRNAIIVKGDTNSYKELRDIYLLSEHSNEFFYYSFTMAHNYNYPDAYFDLFSFLKHSPVKGKMENLKEYYLLKAFELGSHKSKFHIKEKYKNGFIPKSVMFHNGNVP